MSAGFQRLRTARKHRVETPTLFRVVLQVSNLRQAVGFYRKVLGIDGVRVSSGRHYFHCGQAILVCYDPRADGDDFDPLQNPDYIYLAVEDLEAVFARVRESGGAIEEEIARRSWGERSFYSKDPFGNPVCFVDRTTVFTGLHGHRSRPAPP